MTYELAKQLKDAGFPQDFIEGHRYWELHEDGHRSLEICNGTEDYLGGSEEDILSNFFYVPTLSELVEACGDKFRDLTRRDEGHLGIPGTWMTNNIGPIRTYGYSPEEAVANLWVTLNKK